MPFNSYGGRSAEAGSDSASGSPTGSCSSSADEYDSISLTPTQLLGLAIKKRRNLMDEKEHDYRRELLHSNLIQNLCKFLGAGRAKVRRQRRSRNKIPQRRWDVGGRMSERDQVVPDGRQPNSPIMGLAFESTVQNETDGRPRWCEPSMDSDRDGCESPRKRVKLEHYDDDDFILCNPMGGSGDQKTSLQSYRLGSDDMMIYTNV